MIVHLAEVWVGLVVAFFAGCWGGALLFGAIARGRFANAQLALADAVAAVGDFGRARVGMAPVWRSPRPSSTPVRAAVLHEEEPDPVWEVIDRAVQAVRSDATIVAPAGATRPGRAVHRIAEVRPVTPAPATEPDEDGDDLDGLLWEVPDLPDEIAVGAADDAPGVGAGLNGHDTSTDTDYETDSDEVADVDGIDDVDGYDPGNGSDRAAYPVEPDRDDGHQPEPPPLRRVVSRPPARLAPPPPIPARQSLAARNGWRQSQAPLLTAPASNVQNEAPGEIRKPATLAEPRNGVPDNLTRIRGIGERNEVRLNALGVFHFSQIAAWTPAEIAWISQRLAFPERIERDDWVGQAIVLASGGNTGFTKASERRRARRRNGREVIDEQTESPDEA